MVSRTANFCIDADDPRAQARWWAEVLDDFELDPDDTDPEEAGLSGPAGRWLLFLKVPEPKTVKNRIHLDVSPVGCERDEEVARVEALGATRVDVGQGEQMWVVLADPEGNEFCVLGRRADIT